MLTTPLNVDTIDWKNEEEVNAFHEAWIASGQAKLQEDFRRLREMGIVDAQGNWLKKPIVADMLDDSADFGG